MLLTISCKKDARNYFEEDWNIQSITYNGIEKKDDPALHGVTQYVIDFGISSCGGCNEYGTMQALTATDLFFLSFPFGVTDDVDSFAVYCSYSHENQSGSYLPYMIDSALSFCGKEAWKILVLDDHRFTSQLIYKGDTFILMLSK